MNILITGVAGFIGSNFAKWILKNTDHNVIGVDNLSGGFRENLPEENDRFDFFNHDITDSCNMDWLFNTYKPTVCYNFSAYASEGRSNHIRSFIHSNNTVGTANIINACVNHNCKLIFTSSVAVYSGIPPFSENLTASPIDEYGISKYMSEKSIEIAGKTQGLDWCIIRPRNVYGPGQNIFDPSRNFLGIMCYNALNNIPIKIFGEGTNKRSFTYIDDILEPLYKTKGISKEIINLGSERVYTITEAADIFSVVTGYTNIIHTEARHEVAEAFCSIEKSVELLEYKDTTDMLIGVNNMWEWAKKQSMRQLMIPPTLEVTKNAHSSLL